MSSKRFSRLSDAAADEMARDAADPHFGDENLPPPCAETPAANFELLCSLLRSLAPAFDGAQPSRDVPGDPPQLL